MGYYLMFNIPILLYTIIFIYSFTKYQRDYLSQKKTDENGDNEKQETMLPNKLSPILYNKLY